MQSIAPSSATVGVIGLGAMGGAMATHLLRAGYTVLGYDTASDRVAAHTARGGAVAAGPAEIAGNADLVITSLPSVAALDQVTGADGLAGSDHPGLVVIETSTLPLQAKERARQALAARAITLLDCPLSGTGAQAQTGDLVAYASGPPDALAKAAPVLDAFTRSRYDVGEFGTGMKLKVIANHLVAIHNAAAAEAILLAKRCGLDPDLMLRTITDGAGTSRMLEVRGQAMAAGDYTGVGMRVELFLKDIDIITAFAREYATPTPLLATTGQLYTAALAQGRAHQEAGAVMAVLEQLASQPPGSDDHLPK